MRIKKTALFLCICFFVIACGKKREKTEISYSRWEANKCFTEEALLYKNSAAHRVEYFDYQTGHYGPLCGKPNCLHDDLECMAYYLGEKACQIGRIGDSWYYTKIEDDGTWMFCRCNLDGTNEKEIGKFLHSINYKMFFSDDSCFFITRDSIFEEKSEEWLGDISGIYQYHLDTGEAEVLCPEKEGMETMYRLYGQYEDALIYGERVGEGFELRIMDLKTHDIQTPLGNVNVFAGTVSGDFLVCNVREGEFCKIIEFNLKSGEWKEVMSDKRAAKIPCWSSDLKLITIVNGASNLEDFRYEVYQYKEDGECILVREGNMKTYLNPVVIKENLIIGSYGDVGDDSLKFDLAIISKEDFFAGKSNWEVLQY